MGETLKKVRAGDSLKIPAATFNTFIDAARDFQSRTRGLGQKGTPACRRPGIVPVKNNTGSDCDRFAVLGVDAPIFTPSDSEASFKNQTAFKGVIPSAVHAGRFVVLLEPLAAGAIGQACASGVCPVKIDVADADHQFADVRNGCATALASTQAGVASILWKESGTGEKWAIVRIGSPTSATLWGKATSNWVNQSGNGSYVDCNPCKDRDGTDPDTSTTVRVYLPRNGRDEDPNVRADAVIPYEFDGEGDAVCVGDVLDGKIDKSVKIWLDAGTIPAGWSIFGKGKFLVGYDDGDTDYDAVGKTGGFKKHGDTENDHPGHENHTHPLPTCQTGDTGSAGNLLNGLDSGVQNEVFQHTGDADNRPPFTTVVWIKRTS